MQKDLADNARLVVLVLLGDNNFAIAQLALQQLERLGAVVSEAQLLARRHRGQILNSPLHLAQHLNGPHHQIVVLAILLRPVGPVQDDIEHLGVVVQRPFQAVVEYDLVQRQLMRGQAHLGRVFAAQLIGSLCGRNCGIYLSLLLQIKSGAREGLGQAMKLNADSPLWYCPGWD